MCRMVAYLGGPSVPLSSVVLDPEHSLLVQSYAPKEMLSGIVNADGFGVGWYVPEDREPAVYRSNASIWADRSFTGIASKLRASAFFGAVRSATPGLPVEESGVPPFASERYMFMHNGAIQDFRQGAMRPLRDSLSDQAHAELLGVTDSETIFVGLLDRLWEGVALDVALAATVRHVSAVCAVAGLKATLNLAITDGTAMAFSRYSSEGPGNSLYYVEDGEASPGAVVVASERLDGDDGWREVKDGSLLVLDPTAGVTQRKL